MKNTKVELGKLVNDLDEAIKGFDDSRRNRFAQNLVALIVRNLIEEGIAFDIDNPGSVVIVKDFIINNSL